jgi:hypothetical protein
VLQLIAVTSTARPKGKRRLQGYSCAAIAGEYLAKYLPKLVFFLFPPFILLHLPAF